MVSVNHASGCGHGVPPHELLALVSADQLSLADNGSFDRFQELVFGCTRILELTGPVQRVELEIISMSATGRTGTTISDLLKVIQSLFAGSREPNGRCILAK